MTAPGEHGHRKWDPTPGPVRRPEGPCGCEVGVDLARWNAEAGARWNRLRGELSRAGRVEFFRAAEVQKRGALHHHVMLWAPAALDVLEVQRWALAAGYGCVLALLPLDPGRHAGYLAKYVTKHGDQRIQVPWRADVVDHRTGEITEDQLTLATYRAWSCSRGWGLTMRAINRDLRLRARRAAARLRALPWDVAVDQVADVDPRWGPSDVPD